MPHLALVLIMSPLLKMQARQAFKSRAVVQQVIPLLLITLQMLTQPVQALILVQSLEHYSLHQAKQLKLLALF